MAQDDEPLTYDDVKGEPRVPEPEESVPYMIPVDLREEDKPVCFGCYGYRICVERTHPPSNCPWEERCYNSQRDC
jgi:hypothetical protein